MIILLVEDDEAIRVSTGELLRDMGHTVIEAEDAESAMIAIRRRHIDLLFTDVSLPGMAGDVFAAEASAGRPRLRIVFATGVAEISSGDATSGPVLLRKPYTVADIESALQASMR
ncbi:MAG: response regulator [Burkholderiales bacterium]